METYFLERTGDRPLEFEGEIIAESDSRSVSGQDANRWHELTLYRTVSGKLILSITYCSQWQGEMEHHLVEETTEEDIAGILKCYDPCEFISGFPPYPQFQDKQARIEKDLRLRYEKAVSELLADLPEKIE